MPLSNKYSLFEFLKYFIGCVKHFYDNINESIKFFTNLK